MLFVLYPNKDSFITNRVISDNASASLSNMGLAGATMLYHFSGSDNLQGIDAIENSRILMEFDLSSLSNRSDVGFTSPLSATYTLEMMDAPVNEYLPGGFMVEARRVSGTWAEGNGFDLQALSHLGPVNWLSKSVGEPWATPGGDLTGSQQALQFFSNGTENLSMDVTSLVTASLLNGESSLNVCVKLVDAIESGSADVDYKVFYSKDSPNDVLRPRLLAGVSGDATIDQRANIQLGTTGTLTLVWSSGGAFSNVPGLGTGSNIISVELSSSIGYRQFTSASFVKTGFYSAPVSIPLNKTLVDYLVVSGSIPFQDTWIRPSDGAMLSRDTFRVVNPFDTGVKVKNYKVSMPNLRSEYDPSELPILTVFIQDQSRNAAPEAVPSPSVSTQIPGLKYEVRSADNGALIIPASNYTLLSSHGDGSFFWFPMENLTEGRLYEFNFFGTMFGQTVKVNSRPFQFKVQMDVSRDGN